MSKCLECDQEILPSEKRASQVGIGYDYHARCWQDVPGEEDCLHCGGEGWAESDDPLWDNADYVPCSACNGTGARRHETIF